MYYFGSYFYAMVTTGDSGVNVSLVRATDYEPDPVSTILSLGFTAWEKLKSAIPEIDRCLTERCDTREPIILGSDVHISASRFKNETYTHLRKWKTVHSTVKYPTKEGLTFRAMDWEQFKQVVSLIEEDIRHYRDHGEDVDDDNADISVDLTGRTTTEIKMAKSVASKLYQCIERIVK